MTVELWRWLPGGLAGVVEMEVVGGGVVIVSSGGGTGEGRRGGASEDFLAERG